MPVIGGIRVMHTGGSTSLCALIRYLRAHRRLKLFCVGGRFPNVTMPSQNIEALVRLRANVMRRFGLCPIEIKTFMLPSFGEESYVQQAG